MLFFLSAKQKSLSGESTCNRCSHGPKQRHYTCNIHVLLSTNPDKAVEYEATIVILLQFLATTGLPKSILKLATLAMLPTFML